MAILSLKEFISSIRCFTLGTWRVEYQDRSHIPQNAFVALGDIQIEELTRQEQALFRFQPRTPEYFERNQPEAEDAAMRRRGDQLSLRESWERHNFGHSNERRESLKSAPRVILDQLSECLVRTGILQPIFDIDHSEFIRRQGYAVIVLDTNALRDGAIRHLREQFPQAQFWTIIPTVSLMEISERIANITSRDRSGSNPKNYSLLRHRPQVTIVPQEVRWIKENFPTEILELAPELMRAFRGYESNKDPDRITSNDRLILEGIKDLRRQRGLQEGIFLMSGDKDMSRIARIEGLHSIYPAMPDLTEFPEGFRSIRYSLTARTYILCSIHRFLWDIAHVFGKIRIQCYAGSEAGRAIELHYYYSTKLVNDWVADCLEVTEFGPDPAADAV